MSCSPERIAANQKNALKSTGPRTEAGKARSRANALKHGLCANVVVAEDLELVQARTEQFFWALKPQNHYQSWMVDRLSVASLRIERCERMERRCRDRRSLRAELAWEDDRRIEAEALGEKIRARPSQVVAKLRSTPAGCEWLMCRWSMLAKALEFAEQWSPEQSMLAFDLMGTPLEFRDGPPPGSLIDFDGQTIEAVQGQADLARREIAELKSRSEAVADLDEVDRCLTESDLRFDESDLELKKLRRYESALHSRARWFRSQASFESPNHRPHPDLSPKWNQNSAKGSGTEPAPNANPAIEPAPAQAPGSAATLAVPEPKTPRHYWEFPVMNPPFDLEPHEFPAPGEQADIGAIAIARVVKRLAEVESRRESRRRKLEKLRA